MNRIENPVEDLAASIYHALAVGLSDIEYMGVDYGGKTVSEMKNLNKPISEWPRIAKKRRPTIMDIRSVVLFQETWGSGALGFGGMGTAAMTTANTVVITCGNETAVYWSGHLGYVMRANGKSSQFLDDIRRHKTPSRDEAKRDYGDNVRIPE